jgi:putative transposase
MKTAYKFRLYPTKQQEAQLDLTLETCRHLYNLALADRKNAYEVEGISRTYEDQAAMLTAEKKLTVAQRNLSGKKKGSSNRRKAKTKVARLHRMIQNHRDEFLHQVSRKIVDCADLIVFENLNIQGMLKNHHLAKHIQDHAWGKLIQFTQSKAEKAGKIVELVDARYTSQKCSQCGIMVPKTLAERVHHCPNCGLEMDRDINASVNIATLGLRGRACRDIRALTL